MKLLHDQAGFSAIEVAFFVIVMGLVGGTGAYVVNANNNVNDTYAKAAISAQSSPAKVTPTAATVQTSNLVVKEWGVKALYSGKLHLHYAVNTTTSDNSYASVVSDELAAYPGCENAGGRIARYPHGKAEFEDGSLVSDADPKNTNVTLTTVGNYDYMFSHDQAECSDKPSAPADEAQRLNNDAVKQLVTSLVAL